MELSDICGRSAAELAGMDWRQLGDACLDLVNILDPTRDTVALVVAIVCAGVTGIAVLIHRLVVGAEWWVVLLESLEGLLFGATAGYAGTFMGVLLAVLLPPWFLGTLFAVLGVLGLVFAIVAAVRGDADAGMKVLGFIHFLVLVALLTVVAVYCFLVPGEGDAGQEYLAYLWTMGVGLGATSGLHAVFSTILRGNVYVLGVIPLAINGSWGFIGNILGLMTHFASLYSYKDWGKIHEGSLRWCFVCYEKGFSLKTDSGGNRFAFSEGAVMSADSSTLREHEGVHIGQHYIMGPIYPLSHIVWFLAMVIPGLIGAAVAKIGADEGITRMSYYDNPWEVVAYGFINQSGRDTTKDLIWAWWIATLVAVLYILAFIGAFVGWLYWRLG